VAQNEPAPSSGQCVRIGIVVAATPKHQIPALRYLLLQLNTLQSLFEYEFLPTEMSNSPLKMLNHEGGK
jgi:hypothetical protein